MAADISAVEFTVIYDGEQWIALVGRIIVGSGSTPVTAMMQAEATVRRRLARR